MMARVGKIHDDLEDGFDYLFLLLSQKDSTKFNDFPPAGGWSVIQVMQHLYAAEESFLKRMQYVLHEKINHRSSFFRSKARLLTLQLAFFLPFRWKAPEIMGVPDNLERYEDLVQKWSLLRRDLHWELMGLKEEDLLRTCFKHPSVGYMNIQDGLILMGMHLNRHISQIVTLIS
jgi:hypothetical protein